jgi:hypothetical protein
MDGIQLNRSGRIEARPTLETAWTLAKIEGRQLTSLVHLPDRFGYPDKVMVSCVKLFDSESINFANKPPTELIMGQSRPRSDSYLFSPFNGFQRTSTRALPLTLKRVELPPAATFRTSLEGRSTPRLHLDKPANGSFGKNVEGTLSRGGHKRRRREILEHPPGLSRVGRRKPRVKSRGLFFIARADAQEALSREIVVRPG